MVKYGKNNMTVLCCLKVQLDHDLRVFLIGLN